jgi:cytochrome c5
MRTHDLAFLKRFSMLIAFLAFLMVLLILFAYYLNTKVVYSEEASAKEQVLARIAPVGAVYAGATGAAAAAAAAEAAAAAQVANVPFDGRTDGEEIFKNGPCAGCHVAGVGGAPKMDAAGIGARLASQGLEELIKKATDGFTGSAGVMPARGGNPALTDDQMKAVVEYMAAQSK